MVLVALVAQIQVLLAPVALVAALNKPQIQSMKLHHARKLNFRTRRIKTQRRLTKPKRRMRRRAVRRKRSLKRKSRRRRRRLSKRKRKLKKRFSKPKKPRLSHVLRKPLMQLKPRQLPKRNLNLLKPRARLRRVMVKRVLEPSLPSSRRRLLRK